MPPLPPSSRLPGAPQTVDELVMAVFDIHPSQLIDDLHAVEKWMGSAQTLPDALAGLTNELRPEAASRRHRLDPATAFDAARRKLLDLLAEWDRLPQQVSATVLKLLEEQVRSDEAPRDDSGHHAGRPRGVPRSH